MWVIKLKNILWGMGIGVLLLTVASRMILKSQSFSKETMARATTGVIVIDAGHGLPDGGATANGVVESEINLIIAQKLEKVLEERGYEVIMTREDANHIAPLETSSQIATLKAADLNQRVAIINESGADFCLSIHMNQYSNAKYWGWQTFFQAQSEEGKRLAHCIQEEIGKVIPKENKRTALKIDGIKIVDKTKIPVVIVECGFLSNLEEAKLLQETWYQEQLVEGISNGVEAFYNGSER